MWQKLYDSVINSIITAGINGWAKITPIRKKAIIPVNCVIITGLCWQVLCSIKELCQILLLIKRNVLIWFWGCGSDRELFSTSLCYWMLCVLTAFSQIYSTFHVEVSDHFVERASLNLKLTICLPVWAVVKNNWLHFLNLTFCFYSENYFPNITTLYELHIFLFFFFFNLEILK